MASFSRADRSDLGPYAFVEQERVADEGIVTSAEGTTGTANAAVIQPHPVFWTDVRADT
jgi:hypothetical protein